MSGPEPHHVPSEAEDPEDPLVGGTLVMLERYTVRAEHARAILYWGCPLSSVCGVTDVVRRLEVEDVASGY